MDRLRGGDLMQWLSDRGPVPQNVGALLLFDGPSTSTAEQVRMVVRDRLAALPALRRRPVRPPWGCGGWLWLDDPGDPGEQVRIEPVQAGRVDAGPPGDDLQAILTVAAGLVMRRLPADRPPWAAYVLEVTDSYTGRDNTGRADTGREGPVGVLVCLHHVLADGVAGMALLAGLLDGAPPPVAGPAPGPGGQSLPPRRVLLADAWARRVARLRHLPAVPGELRAAWAEMGSGRTPKAPPSSLNRPTGPRRDVAVVDVELAGLRATAHAAGASVNDALLVAAGSALADLQAGRGEQLEYVVASVPVAARDRTARDRTAGGRAERDRAAGDLGNAVGAVPFAVPTTGALADRLSEVTRARTQRLSGPHGASMPLVLAAFRVLSALHLVQRYATHQRLVNTFVTNVRGPQLRVSLLGTPVSRLLPFVLNQGNVTASFAAVSYANTMSLVVTTDPDAGLPAADVAEHLRRRLAELTG